MNQAEAPFTRRALRRVAEMRTGQHEFSVVTYNILADVCLLQNVTKKGGYSHCPNAYKYKGQGKRSHRHNLFMAEVCKQ